MSTMKKYFILSVLMGFFSLQVGAQERQQERQQEQPQEFETEALQAAAAVAEQTTSQATVHELASDIRSEFATVLAPKTVAPAPVSVNAVPVKVVYVSENQPVQIVDSQGRLLQVIYLKRK
jgi:hypothetical protein